MTDGHIIEKESQENGFEITMEVKMGKFGQKVVKLRIPILIISFLLLIPAAFGYFNTRINYDILSYLPSDIETMEGQDILLDEFGKGAFALIVVEDMDNKDVATLKENIENVDHVESVIWYDSLADLSIPMELIPNKYLEAFKTDHATLMAAFFDETSSADGSLDAVNQIRKLAKDQCFISGMTSVVLDTKNISNQETPMYVAIAAGLTFVVLAVFMDSFLIPFFFLLSIGMAIVYNLGSNVFLGQISFITQALTAVLQLGVTMDYSIFLWHSYSEEKHKGIYDTKEEAMAHAINSTVVSVVSSSITTVAGFVALCFMSFTLGLDLGVVMAKGVVLGVIGCVTILPAFILTFDRAIEKTTHKSFNLDFIKKIAAFIVKFRLVFIALFLIILGPALYGYNNTKVYYNLTDTLPKDLGSVVANTKLEEEFNMNSVFMVLADTNMSAKDSNKMINDLKSQDGIKFAMSFDSLIGTSIPDEAIPSSIKDLLKSDKWQLMLVGSEYKVASDEVNNQINDVNAIVKSYGSNGMVIGEAPCTKDLIEITDNDFKTVSVVSIAAIFVIILCVFKSISLPVILVTVIEFAIFINMGLPYYTNTTIPFIASVVIGTIQLGATVDYAILMTTRYKRERMLGLSKHDSVTIALSTSIPSIVVSALGFFAATFGVGIYSSIDMISSLCKLMSRGAIISMFVVILLLPSFLMVFDKLILKTSLQFKPPKELAEGAETELKELN